MNIPEDINKTRKHLREIPSSAAVRFSFDGKSHSLSVHDLHILADMAGVGLLNLKSMDKIRMYCIDRIDLMRSRPVAEGPVNYTVEIYEELKDFIEKEMEDNMEKVLNSEDFGPVK